MGKNVSFEIATDNVEGPAHQTEIAIRRTAEENEVPAELESEKGPLV